MQQKKKDFATGILIGLSILTVMLVSNPQHVDSILWRLCDGFFLWQQSWSWASAVSCMPETRESLI